MLLVGPMEQRSQLAQALARFGAKRIGVVGDTTAASPTIANVVAAEPLSIGLQVKGAGIPAGATIIDIDTVANNIILSLAATATAVGVNLSAVGVVALMVHLCKDMPAPGIDPVPADFTAHECNFDTYAALPAGPLVGPYTNAMGNAEVDSAQLAWVMTLVPAVGNNVVAYWIQYQIGMVSYVLGWEPLPSTLPMQGPGNAVVITVPIQLPIQGKVVVVP